MNEKKNAQNIEKDGFDWDYWYYIAHKWGYDDEKFWRMSLRKLMVLIEQEMIQQKKARGE